MDTPSPRPEPEWPCEVCAAEQVLFRRRDHDTGGSVCLCLLCLLDAEEQAERMPRAA